MTAVEAVVVVAVIGLLCALIVALVWMAGR